MDYLTGLHRRVATSNQARSERDMRRRRALVEQMNALHEQEVRAHYVLAIALAPLALAIIITLPLGGETSILRMLWLP